MISFLGFLITHGDLSIDRDKKEGSPLEQTLKG